jgi:hypothetical protein
VTDVREYDLISYDPLSEVTRRERKALLGVSMLGLALVKVPLVPSKLAAFGIEFSDLNRQNFAFMYSLVVGYFLIAFLVYAFSDFVAWRRSEVIRYSAYLQAQRKDPPLVPSDLRNPLVGESGHPLRPQVPGPSPAYRGFASWGSAVIASRLRAIFEFALPVAFALYALRVLLSYTG